jgi:hypothetical protein
LLPQCFNENKKKIPEDRKAKALTISNISLMKNAIEKQNTELQMSKKFNLKSRCLISLNFLTWLR